MGPCGEVGEDVLFCCWLVGAGSAERGTLLRDYICPWNPLRKKCRLNTKTEIHNPKPCTLNAGGKKSLNPKPANLYSRSYPAMRALSLLGRREKTPEP